MEDEYPSSFQGFKIMRLKFSEESKAAHQILWKRHSVRTYCESKPPDRTLFVVNLPPYCTEASIRHLFSRYGDIRNVYFHKKPSSDLPHIPKYPNFSKVTPVKGFKVAYVVFTNVSGIKCAMEASSADVLILSTPEHPVLTGVRSK
ncbi:Ribosomal RNA-processing protein 7 A [Halocaridina rubra]|uniref:Ribosomal RNA-processing protein 7 A n=1 Tax=Halocaridina rubra TaxID=373956 RepID=A0AAN8WK90_HALRR